MKLYLSSYGWGDEPQRLVELVGNKPKRVAIVTNATDVHGESGTVERLDASIDTWVALGFEIERLDLRVYFNKPNELKAKLSEFGLVWATGGNSFVLRRAMSYSGFDKIIVPMLEQNEIVYGGFSAGACVMTPTLKGIDICDDPNDIPEGYQSEIIWEGLNLVPYSIAPHYKSDHPESEIIDRVVEYFEHHHMSYKALRDGEAIIVNGAINE